MLKLANVTTNPCLMRPHYISYIIKVHTKLLRSLRLLDCVLGGGDGGQSGGESELGMAKEMDSFLHC